MSEPLSKVFQFKRKPSPTYFPANEGYNLCLDELDQRSPDVKKLAFIIYKVEMRNLTSEDEIKSIFNMHHVTWNPTVNECYVKAQEIINKIDVWVVKKG